jgi:hypothetical protein
MRCCECTETIDVPPVLSLDATAALLAAHGWVMSLTDPERGTMKPLCPSCAKAIYGAVYDEGLRIIRGKGQTS